jgi:hypothetical protein
LGKGYVLIFTKNGMVYILGDFFSIASGHPVCISKLFNFFRLLHEKKCENEFQHVVLNFEPTQSLSDTKIFFKVNIGFMFESCTPRQGYQMVHFQTKNLKLGIFWTAWDWRMLVYFKSIWNILQPFCICCGHLVILVYFSLFWLYYLNRNLATLVDVEIQTFKGWN